MLRLTICETKNGWLVVDGEVLAHHTPMEVIVRSWSFDSLSAAISEIEKQMQSWHPKEDAYEDEEDWVGDRETLIQSKLDAEQDTTPKMPMEPL